MSSVEPEWHNDGSSSRTECPTGLACTKDALVCTQEDALVCTQGDALVCTQEDALVCTQEDALVCTQEDALVCTQKDALVCTQEDALVCTQEVTLHNGDSGASVGAMVETQQGVCVGVGVDSSYGDFAVGDHVELGNDCTSEISSGDPSLPEVCVSTNNNNNNNNGSFEEDMNYEVQQAYRIFSAFLLDKYKGLTESFLLPVGDSEAQHDIGGVGVGGGGGGGHAYARRRRSMCLQRMEEKFVGRQYDTITEFVTDFRLMLENCYRHHGVDHWLSKQAQKMEVMLEQKLTLLSRTLREKTVLAVTSQGRFGAEEERSPGATGTSTRRRSAPRSLSTTTVGGQESVMVQALRLEEVQRAKEEKRQRELDKKEAEENSAKEVEEWERSLLSQAAPHPVDTLWELPAIGHFLCLAQAALHLPEIVFLELERSLLMPRCSLFLARVMTSLLCPPLPTPLHRRQPGAQQHQQQQQLRQPPPLPYHRWELLLRQRVLAWYRATGASVANQPARAERLGLCHRFFCVLGDRSPLEEQAFHLLPFYRRVWLLKGLCDHVYETRAEVQAAVLAQPIHECRESILGYDCADNAYIHFPHFCGADLRIYFQSPCAAPAFPFPPLWARPVDEVKVEEHEAEDAGDVKDWMDWKEAGCYGVSLESDEEEEAKEEKEDEEEMEKGAHFKRENGSGDEAIAKFPWLSLKEAESDSGSVDSAWTSVADSKSALKVHTANSSSRSCHSRTSAHGGVYSKQQNSRRVKQQQQQQQEEEEEAGPAGDSSSSSSSSVVGRAIEAETWEPCLSVGEHCYTGRSPVCAAVNMSAGGRRTERGGAGGGGGGPAGSSPLGHQQQVPPCLQCSGDNGGKSVPRNCRCSAPATSAVTPAMTPAAAPSSSFSSSGSSSSSSSSESVRRSSNEKTNEATIGTRKRKREKKRERVQAAGAGPVLGAGQRKRRRRRLCLERPRRGQTRSGKATSESADTTQGGGAKDRRRKSKQGKRVNTSSNETKGEPHVESPFKLVCSSIDELRELISKTEDQLDTLQSAKKRSGRWYLKKEAVKDLHITLIRLLNELLPWEPKLLKAFHRNRLRMKKECDDFRKHPDFGNFVREECAPGFLSPASSAASSLDHEERGLGRDAGHLSDQDMELEVPKGLWTAGNSMQRLTESAGGDSGSYGHPARPLLGTTDEELNIRPGHALNVDSSLTSPTHSASDARSEPGSTTAAAQSRDLNPAPPVAPAQAPPPRCVPILHPTIGLPRGYTPIPTLFARSVGNKVTLMKRPHDFPWPKGSPAAKNPGRAGAGTPASFPLAVTEDKSPVLQKPPTHPHQAVPPTQPEATEQQRHKCIQSVVSTVTACLTKPAQAKPTAPLSPVKVVYRVADGLNRALTQGGGSGQVKLAVQPLVDQKPGEKVTKQVVILPSRLLLQNDEEASLKHQPQPPKSIHQAPVSKTASPLHVSTLMPGFAITDGRIPVQQVAPLKEAGRLKTPSPSGPPCLQQKTGATAKRKVAQVCGPQSAAPTHLPMPSSSNVPANAAALARDSKQELKTVCIRDSQSILVTTRGGNTGIVKVQTSAEQNAHGSSPASPVITISPQFKAFLVSKGSPAMSLSSSSLPTPTSATVMAPVGPSPAQGTSQAQVTPPAQVPSPSQGLAVSKSSAATPPLTTVPSNMFPAGGLAVTLGHSPISTASVLPIKGKLAIKTTNPQMSLVQSNMIMPSLCTSIASASTQETSLMSKPGMKRPSTEARTQFAKFILVSPTASTTCPTSPDAAAALPKVSSPLASPAIGSRLMFIGESTNMKSEPSSTLHNFTMPSGVQLNHPGQMKHLGQTIDTVLRSPSKSTPAPPSSGLVLLKGSASVLGAPVPTAAVVSLTTTYSSLQQQPLSVVVPHKETSRCTSTVVPSSSPGCPATKALGSTNVCVPSFQQPPLGPLTVHQSLANATKCSPAHQPLQKYTTSPIGTPPPPVVTPTTRPASGVPLHTTSTSIPSTANSSLINTNACAPVATTPTPMPSSVPSTVQQRIVINTSSHLAAGTQIILNNARFVVPPQGLGPGSHVLIISGQAPPPLVPPSTGNSSVPAVAAAAAASPMGPRPVSVAPRMAASPISPRPRTPCPMPALRPPIAVQPPPVRLPALSMTSPNNVRFVGAPSLSPSLVSNVTKLVSTATLPRLQQGATQGLSLPAAGTSTFLPSPIRLGGKPTLVFATKTSASVLGSPLPALNLPTGITAALPVTSAPQPSNATPSATTTTLPLPSCLAASTPCPSSTTGPIAFVTSVVAHSPEGIPLLASTAPAKVAHWTDACGSQARQTALRLPASALSPASTASSPPNTLHTGPINQSSVKAHLQQLGARTQVVPTVAVSPIVNAASRLQPLPVATVQPTGGVVINSFLAPPMANALPTATSSSSSITTTAITSLKLGKMIQAAPVVLVTTQALAMPVLPVQAGGCTATSMEHKLHPRLDDGGVAAARIPELGVNPAGGGPIACPKPLARLVTLPSAAKDLPLAPVHTNSLPPTTLETSKP